MKRSLGYLTLTRLLMNTAYRFAYPFLPAISRGLGVSLEQGGLLLSTQWVAGTMTPLAVSAAGHDTRRLRLTTASLLILIAGAATTALSGVYAGALVGFALVGLAKPTFDVAARAYVADRTPFARRGRSLAVLELTWSGALLIGSPFAGWMIDRYGWQTPFWVWVGLGVLSLTGAAWALRPTGSVVEHTGPRPALTRPGIILLAVTALFTASSEITFVVFGAWLEDRFALSLVALGGAATLIALSELTAEGTTLAIVDRIGPRRMVAAGLVISTLTFAALGPAAGHLQLGLTVLALAFFGFELTFVASIPLVTEVAPTARAAYLAIWTVVVGLTRGGGAAIGPVIFGWGGFAANAAVSAAANAAALGLLLTGIREHQETPAGRSAPPADRRILRRRSREPK